MSAAPTTGLPVKPPSPYRLLGLKGEILDTTNERAAQDRIQTLLAQWLRMENVVVLTGAGSSMSQGGASLNGLEKFTLNAVKEICDADATLTQSAKLIQERLDAIGKPNPMYFERWLSFIASAEFILSQKETPISKLQFGALGEIGATELSNLLRLIGQTIYVRCSLALPALLDKPSGHHALIAKLLARDAALGRANIFTTNYDTLMEQGLDDLAVQYTDGFVGTVKRRFDPSCYSLDAYYPGEVAEGRVRRFDKFVHLYKPHGSVHWRRSPNGRLYQRTNRISAEWQNWSKTPAADKLKHLKEVFAQDGDAICILPTENKFVQTLGMPFAHLFRAFHHRLQVPQTFLLVIGYSFGDEHINAVINEAMSNPSLVLLVVDPLPSDALKQRIIRYQQTGERAFLLTAEQPDKNNPTLSTFDDFAQKLMPHVQWLDDYIKLRKSERAASNGDVT
jgi:hypothetical protein